MAVPPPPTRSQRQAETRQALVHAALAAFARDGYHGANLERIARDAGFSKGAVYSNFTGKADLFLAVMDRNLAALGDDDWDPFEPPAPPADVAADGDEEPWFDRPEAADAIRGFALATLEFIATASRDEQLAVALRERVRLLLGAYTRTARRARPDGEVLEVEEVGALLAALDQGVALLALTGITPSDAGLLRTGLRRLLDPVRAAADGRATAPPGVGPVHDPEIQRRVLRDVEER